MDTVETVCGFHVVSIKGLIEMKQVSVMNLKDYKKEKIKDPVFAKAYEEIQPEMNVIRAMIEARTSQNLTQKQLAEKTGIAQTEISRLENGTRNPSIKLLQRLAEGMGMVLDVQFKPKGSSQAAATSKG